MSIWTTLVPSLFKLRSHFFPINKTEFVVLASTHDGNGIYKYNVNDNEWMKIFDYKTDFISIFNSAAFDKSDQLLYVCNNQYLLEFNLNSKSMKILSEKNIFHNYGCTKMICINGTLHLITDYNKHFIFDKNTQSLKQIYQFKIYANQFLGNMLYLKSKQTIVLFDTNLSEVHQFQIKNNKWNKYKFEPINDYLTDSSIVCTKNEEYFVVLGGRKRHTCWSDSIFIYNVKNNNLMKSSIKCPFKKGISCKATIMRHDTRDNLMVFGFIRQLLLCPQLPFYIIKLIGSSICNEWIHLSTNSTFIKHAVDSGVNYRYRNGEHWKIHIDSIIHSEKQTL